MRVLSVDDSFDWLKIHAQTISRVFGEDTEIISACSATEALNIYKENYIEKPFDIVITDLQMESDFEPLLAGELLIKEIRNLNLKQKILIVSSTYNIDQIASLNHVDYISKRTIVADPISFQTKLEITYK